MERIEDIKNSEGAGSFRNGFQILEEMPSFAEFRATEKIKDALSMGKDTVATFMEDGELKSKAEIIRQKSVPEAYTKERQKWHTKILDGATNDAAEMSRKLGDPPRIIAMRGGCGSGKTTAIRHIYGDKGILDANGDVPGAVKPDYFKTLILENAKNEYGVEITSDQTHLESTGVCKMYVDRLKKRPDITMLIDKQLEDKSDIEQIIRMGRESGKPVEIYDNDVPLELAAYRVLKRRTDGLDPNITFDRVANGFIAIRENRRAILGQVEDDIVSNYSLRVFNPVTRHQQEVIQKTENGLEYLPGCEELGKAVIAQGGVEAEADATELRSQEITEDYVWEFIEKYADLSSGATEWSEEARTVLGAYVGTGMTLAEALDSKANGITANLDLVTGEYVDPNYREKLAKWKQERMQSGIKETEIA